MQWDEVTVSSEAMPANDSQPDMGNPHPSLAKALIRVLELDSSRYNFATWEGYAAEDGKSVIDFSPAHRGMVLYSGKVVDEKGTAIVPITDSGRVPMYWWPDDLHWCIGQDIYARSLIIGCDIATAGRILADPELDAYLIRETDTVLLEDFSRDASPHARCGIPIEQWKRPFGYRLTGSNARQGALVLPRGSWVRGIVSLLGARSQEA